MKNKYLRIIALTLLLVFILSACGSKPKHDNSSVNQKKTSESSKGKNNTDLSKEGNLLNTAKSIEIKESLISLGKKYKLYVDGKYAGEVTGKLIKLFGDEFTLEDANGTTLAKEKQVKRWHIKFDRSAVVMDSDDRVTGYIGEEAFTKIFSIGYFFHFFDKNRREIGTSDQVNFSLFKKNIFKNSEGSTAYKVNKEFTFFTDSYKLNIIDKTKIPLYQAIFMVCIEDAIKDSKDKENASKKAKKRR